MFEKVRSPGSIVKGMLVGLALNLAAFFCLTIMALQTKMIFPAFYFGLTQAILVVPLILYLRKAGESETAKGVAVAAGITFLLSATCWVFYFPSAPKFPFQ